MLTLRPLAVITVALILITSPKETVYFCDASFSLIDFNDIVDLVASARW